VLRLPIQFFAGAPSRASDIVGLARRGPINRRATPVRFYPHVFAVQGNQSTLFYGAAAQTARFKSLIGDLQNHS